MDHSGNPEDPNVFMAKDGTKWFEGDAIIISENREFLIEPHKPMFKDITREARTPAGKVMYSTLPYQMYSNATISSLKFISLFSNVQFSINYIYLFPRCDYFPFVPPVQHVAHGRDANTTPWISPDEYPMNTFQIISIRRNLQSLQRISMMCP